MHFTFTVKKKKDFSEKRCQTSSRPLLPRLTRTALEPSVKKTSFLIPKFFLDLAEAQQIVKALGFDYTEAQVETFFKKYDADNSGTLNKSEAEALVREVYPAAFE